MIIFIIIISIFIVACEVIDYYSKENFIPIRVFLLCTFVFFSLLLENEHRDYKSQVEGKCTEYEQVNETFYKKK